MNTHTSPGIFKDRLPVREPTLMEECPDCEGGRQWFSRWGGNDPDVWAVKCKRCDGHGAVVADESDCVHCDGFGRIWNNSDQTSDQTSGQWQPCTVCGDTRGHP